MKREFRSVIFFFFFFLFVCLFLSSFAVDLFTCCLCLLVIVSVKIEFTAENFKEKLRNFSSSVTFVLLSSGKNENFVHFDHLLLGLN